MARSNIIGENIRIYRELKGYSQDYMAMKLEMSQPGYAKIESGQSSCSVDKLSAIAGILEMDVKDLLYTGERNFIANYDTIHGVNGIVENLYSDNKEVYNKLIEQLKSEIAYLKNIIEQMKK